MKMQWQLYKTLEQIPDSVSELPTQPQGLRRITYLWRSVVDAMSGKDTDTLQLEHLERCLQMELTPDQPVMLWQKCWEFLHRSLSLQEQAITAEPQIWQSVDNSGQTWWHVYSPRTGERVDLVSEDEVCTWIEQSFYR